MHLRLPLRAKALFRHHMRGCTTFSAAQPKVVTVGIDFGCKNSRVAIIDSLVPQVVDSESGCSTPSYVTAIPPKDSDGRYAWALQRLEGLGKCVAVGELAKRRTSRQPSDVVFNIKKLIGKQFGDHYVQETRKRVHFGIVEGERGEAWVEIYGMKISPVDIASVIFAKLKDVVLMHQFHHELKAVISVPIFFSKQQREDIVLAGNKAGLEILKLIDEPTAAALSSITIKEGTVVVFDMGAGSYTVSILGVSGTDIEVKTQFGDPSVGGDQFDDIILDYFVTQIIDLHQVDIRGDKYVMMLLAEAAAQAKVELSSQHEVTVSLPYIIPLAHCSGYPEISISRREFERLAVNHVEQIQDKCRELLTEANITDKDIDEVVLTGGMTRVPIVRKIIYQVFGKDQVTRVNHEEAVVIGSAIQAALIVEDEREMSGDMIPLSIGIESEGVFMRVFPRHTKIPTERKVKIPAWRAYGERLRIKVFLGEHVMVSHNTFLGEIELINNRWKGQGSVHFELKFEIDADYMVKVTGRNADDGAYKASRAAVKVFPVRGIMTCKHSVDEAVREALLGWAMHGVETHARLINMARHIANTLSDVLSARKDEVLKELAARKDNGVPRDLGGDATKALADLLAALDDPGGQDAVHVLKDKMLAAVSAEQMMLLDWRPTRYNGCYSGYGNYSDCEDEDEDESA